MPARPACPCVALQSPLPGASDRGAPRRGGEAAEVDGYALRGNNEGADVGHVGSREERSVVG